METCRTPGRRGPANAVGAEALAEGHSARALPGWRADVTRTEVGEFPARRGAAKPRPSGRFNACSRGLGGGSAGPGRSDRHPRLTPDEVIGTHLHPPLRLEPMPQLAAEKITERRSGGFRRFNRLIARDPLRNKGRTGKYEFQKAAGRFGEAGSKILATIHRGGSGRGLPGEPDGARRALGDNGRRPPPGRPTKMIALPGGGRDGRWPSKGAYLGPRSINGW